MCHIELLCINANKFAEFFCEKLTDLKNQSRVSAETVFNGSCKLIVDDRFFMSEADVRECLSLLKPKRSEGYDKSK